MFCSIVINTSVLYNYFDAPTKLFSDLQNFYINTTAKSFFSCTNRENCIQIDRIIRDVNWARIAFLVILRQAVSTFVNHNGFEMHEGFTGLSRLRFPLKNNMLGCLTAFRSVIEFQISARWMRN